MRIALVLAAAASFLACAAKNIPGPDTSTAGLPGPSPSRAETDEIVREYDLDHDRKPDVWKITRKRPGGNEVLVRVERDLNGDGKVDIRESYDAEGNVERQVIDLDFDGKPDVVLYFEKGQLVRKEYAFGFDGKPHAWNYYEKNQLVSRERDENGDGKVDYWEFWQNGEIDRIGLDTDGDGKVDKWESRKAPTAENVPPPRLDAAAAPQK